MRNKTLILGIETSCDETSVAVLNNGIKVLSCEIATSVPLHIETKGVVPEVAARAQIDAMIPVLDRALKIAKVKMDDIDLIAVTEGPGLIGSLLVGIQTANTLSIQTGIPVVGVPHIWGHMYANLLEQEDEINFPVLVLTVSGGHNDLYLWKGHGKFQKLGGTLDDAAGEAFDKCGRLMGLNYPAGKEIGELSEKGNNKAYNFPRSMKNSKDYNFSFSGLKTAFLYTLEKNMFISKGEKSPTIKSEEIYNLAASLQEAIVESLYIKIEKALNEFDVNEVHISGGVAANKRLREYCEEKLKNRKLRYPKKILYCTDNAAMIACAAYFCEFKECFVEAKL